MNGHRAPAWVAAILRRLLPEGYARDVLADLEADARRRRDRGGSSPWLGLWYLRQVASPAMIGLAWRLRRRAGGSGPGGQSGGGLAADLRDAARGLRRSPFFTLAAVASLALGIGANAAIFSVVNAVLLRPLPYHQPDRLAFVWNRIPGFDLARLPLSGIEIVELRKEQSVFRDVGGIWATNQTLVEDERALLVSVGLVTPNFFQVLGADPALGRTFGPDEGAGAGPSTVVLSDGAWRRDFAGDPGVLGRTLRLEGGEAVVVGVLPPSFELAFPPQVGVPERLDVYVPFPWAAADQPGGSRFLRTVARMRAGVTPETADATVRSVAERLRRTYVEIGQVGDEFRAAPLQADTVERVRPVLLALMGGVGVFLLLTAVNVASLVLARSAARRQELAVRTCLGASRPRLERLLLAETGLLTALGGALGLVVGWWGIQALWALRPTGITRVDEVVLDPAVVGMTVLAAAVAGAVAAFGPLARLRRTNPMELLRRTVGGAPPGGPLGRRVATGAEVALSVVLVVGAGLLARTLTQLRSTELGFEPRQVLTFRVGLSQSLYPSDGERAELARWIEDEVRDLPGVVAVGGSSHIPLADWANWSSSAPPEGTPEEEREAYHFDHRSVTPGYLEALGATLVTGRHFRADDTGASQAVVIVDRALADRVFPGEEPLGRRLLATRYVGGAFVPTPATIVGVVESLRDHAPTRPSTGQVFWPFAQSARWELTYAVRTEGDPGSLVDAARSAVAGIPGELAAADFRTLDDYVSASTGETRFVALLAGILSAMSLALAALGLYGVISYSTARRTRELGLRLALGARARDLFVRVVGEGLGIGAAGVAAGLAAAALLTRYLAALLFEVSPLDPVVFAGVAAFLLLVAGVASAGPALRATRVDPVTSLRAE